MEVVLKTASIFIMANNRDIDNFQRMVIMNNLKMNTSEYDYNNSVYHGPVFIRSQEEWDMFVRLKIMKFFGELNLQWSNIKYLDGCPDEIDGILDIRTYSLVSLKGGPKIMNGSYDCAANELMSLEGCPEIIGKSQIDKHHSAYFSAPFGYFNCGLNPISSLKHSPKIIEGDFISNRCDLKNLKYFPDKVTRSVDLSWNKLESIEGLPKHIPLNLDISNNELDPDYVRKYFDEGRTNVSGELTY